MSTTKELLLQAGQLKTATVNYAGVDCQIRELSANQRDEFMALTMAERESDSPRWFRVNAELCRMGCPDLEDLELDEVMELSSDLVTTFADKIMDLSGMSEGADDEAKKPLESSQD